MCRAWTRRKYRALTLPSRPCLQTPPVGTERPACRAPVASAPYSRELETISVRQDGGKRLLDHIARQTPVVIHDLASDWPALHNWSPERLSDRFGARLVRVCDATFGDPGPNYMKGVTTMSFAQFLRLTLREGRDLRLFLYNISRHTPELLNEVALPDLGPRWSRRFVHAFFGCRGSTTPLHYDIDMGCVLHTAITGRRRVRLFDPEQSRALGRHPFTVRSYADLDQPDCGTFPALAQVRGYEFLLHPGQTLFMPSGYWHEVHYADAGMGLSFRAMGPRLSQRLEGAFNLLALSPIDRLANQIAPDRWFDWKRRRATARAAAVLRPAANVP